MDALNENVSKDAWEKFPNDGSGILKAMFRYLSNGAETIPESVILVTFEYEAIELDPEQSNETIILNYSKNGQVDFESNVKTNINR